MRECGKAMGKGKAVCMGHRSHPPRWECQRHNTLGFYHLPRLRQFGGEDPGRENGPGKNVMKIRRLPGERRGVSPPCKCQDDRTREEPNCVPKPPGGFGTQ